MFPQAHYTALSESAKERLKEMSVPPWAFDVAEWGREPCEKKPQTDSSCEVLQQGQPEENGTPAAAALPNEQAPCPQHEMHKEKSRVEQKQEEQEKERQQQQQHEGNKSGQEASCAHGSTSQLACEIIPNGPHTSSKTTS